MIGTPSVSRRLFAGFAETLVLSFAVRIDLPVELPNATTVVPEEASNASIPLFATRRAFAEFRMPARHVAEPAAVG